MAISYPPIFVNNYLAEKIKASFGTTATVPFFPTGPSTIEQLTQTFPDSEGLFCVYDRMFRMRRKAFPHIKDEQLLYYFYKTAGDPELLIETTQLVQDLLDRGDESGQEVNAWIANNPKLFTRPDGQKVYQPLNPGTEYRIENPIDPLSKAFLPVFFHEFTIYQLEEARDIVDFGTARTFAGNKIIISYCYHTVGEKLSGNQITYNDTII